MKFKDPLYYCSQCKKVSSSLDDLFFVEEGSPRGFCSETCIEKFYTPLINYYEALEKDLRKEKGVLEKDLEKYVSENITMDQVLQEPNEVWVLSNEMMEEVYSFITFVDGKDESNLEPFYLITLCLIFEKQPSFIFLATATRNNDLLDEFRIGEKVQNIEEFQNVQETQSEGWTSFGVDEEMMNLLGSKKSSYLATLLEKRSPADIPFENFDLYQDYLETTVEDPDELYTHVDDDGDKILTYIKAYEREGISFFYFVICLMPAASLEDKEERALFPILSFPSLDGELCKFYKQGEQLSGTLKN